MNYEQHVFHRGCSKQHEAFVAQNKDRVVCEEVADDRTIVYCRPVQNGESVVFVAGHFFGGI